MASRGTWAAVVGLLVLHSVLLGWGAWRHSPGWDEVGHLYAGISHWLTGDLTLYRVNPPLVRMVAAAPVVVANPGLECEVATAEPGVRIEFGSATAFLSANGEKAFWLFTLARWACIPFSIIGALACFQWARQLYGCNAGMLALVLWSLSPNVLGNAQMITPDTAAAAFAAVAGYVFWRWLKQSNWISAFHAGVALGLAELTKTTLIILFGLWPILCVVYRLRQEREPARHDGRRVALQLALILALGVYVLNVGYGFDGWLERLEDYSFVSDTLGGTIEHGQPVEGRNRFRGSWLGAVPLPLPREYVLGIDQQKWEFERRMWSYLRGEWRLGGWWYYYVYALLIKVPLGAWILVVLAAVTGTFCRGYSADWRDELLLIAPVGVILALVSSQTGFNHHSRYLLPIFPFAIIWTSKVARAWELKHAKTAALAAGALAWSVTSSLWIYPHSLSYFNELVGGPRGGHAHLLDSNIDWGQDLLYLRRWLDQHPDARPLYLAYCLPSNVIPQIAGMEFDRPPAGAPVPGWYAVSVREIRNLGDEYRYFLDFVPVGMAGYSIYIYHIDPDHRTDGVWKDQSREKVRIVSDER